MVSMYSTVYVVMPASRSALATAGLEPTGDASFANSDLVEGAHLAFLGDVFAIPAGWPGANVFSVGDVLLVAGALLALHVICGSRLGMIVQRAALPRRGRRAQRGRRFAHRRTLLSRGARLG